MTVSFLGAISKFEEILKLQPSAISALEMYQRLRDIQLLHTQLGRFFTAITHSFPTQNQTILSDPQNNFGEKCNLTPEELVELTINTHIAHATKNAATGGDESFFVVDLGEVTRQHEGWKKNLPDVQPYYGKHKPDYNPTILQLDQKYIRIFFQPCLLLNLAVKCNSDPTLLKHLANLGTGFDCASIKEMQTVLDLGVEADRILFANPCKSQSSLVFARKAGILRTTFDNRDELDTIKTCMPDAQLLLRIYANDDTALITLGEKYGAHMDTVQSLLSRVKELGLNLIGISFHVGAY